MDPNSPNACTYTMSLRFTQFAAADFDQPALITTETRAPESSHDELALYL